MTAPEADAREYVVAYDSLCERVDRCTCAEGTAESSYAHEEGCGLEQVASLDQIFGALTEQAERDAPDQGDDPWSPAPGARSDADALVTFIAEYDRRGVAEAENRHGWDVSHKFAKEMCERVRNAEAERDRLRAFLLEATGTLPAHGFTNDELGDPWVRWLERVAAYLTETHR